MPYLACSTIEYGSYPNGEEIVLKTTGPKGPESSNLSASAIFKKTPDLIKFWGFLLPKIYPYEYHSFTAKYLIDRYY